MVEHPVPGQLPEVRSEYEIKTEQYYCAEFAIDGLAMPYQFKIWNFDSTSMAVLVNEKSDILPCLKVGKTFNVKYYSHKSPYPSDFMETSIRHITRNEQGRLRGHYIVGLEILSCRNQY